MHQFYLNRPPAGGGSRRSTRLPLGIRVERRRAACYTTGKGCGRLMGPSGNSAGQTLHDRSKPHGNHCMNNSLPEESRPEAELPQTASPSNANADADTSAAAAPPTPLDPNRPAAETPPASVEAPASPTASEPSEATEEVAGEHDHHPSATDEEVGGGQATEAPHAEPAPLTAEAPMTAEAPSDSPLPPATAPPSGPQSATTAATTPPGPTTRPIQIGSRREGNQPPTSRPSLGRDPKEVAQLEKARPSGPPPAAGPVPKPSVRQPLSADLEDELQAALGAKSLDDVMAGQAGESAAGLKPEKPASGHRRSCARRQRLLQHRHGP